MSYSFNEFKENAKEVEDWFAKEMGSIHTGRAMPTLLDGVVVNSYGAKSPVSHIAGITTEDARTLRIAPWDKGQIQDIEKAINDADLGVSVSSDDDGVRVFFPELTTERRTSLAKILKERMEKARISLRGHRERVWEDIQEKEKDGDISEDDKYKLKDDLQKLIDDANSLLEKMADRKETEIMN